MSVYDQFKGLGKTGSMASDVILTMLPSLLATRHRKSQQA